MNEGENSSSIGGQDNGNETEALMVSHKDFMDLRSTVSQLDSKISTLEGKLLEISVLANGGDLQGVQSVLNDGNNNTVETLVPLSLESVSNMKLFEKDNYEDETLPEDTFTFFVTSPVLSSPFVSACIVFCFQVITFSLVAMDVGSPESDENPFDIPANVNTEVRIVQLLALLIAVITQDDVRTGLSMVLEGYNKGSLRAAFQYVRQWKWILSILTRLIEGGLGLVVTFLLIVTAETALDLLLNFTAVEFVSQLDDFCFLMSREGFFGMKNQQAAKEICDTTYRKRGGGRNRRRFGLLLFFFSNLFVGWIVVASNQNSGKYLCSTIFVQFSDDFNPLLGTFSGLYDRQDPKGNFFTSSHVTYVDRKSQTAAFTYCTDMSTWTFTVTAFLEADADPCQSWMAMSGETISYDLTETSFLDWHARAGSRKVILDHFFLSCYDCDEDDTICGGHGTCHDAVCSCHDGHYGLRCEFPEPCPVLQFDERFGVFSGSHVWSTEFNRLVVNNEPVRFYHRPVYIKEYSPGMYDIIFFTGRRWVATYSGILPETVQGLPKDMLAAVLDQFHPGLMSFAFTFGSAPVDIESPNDAATPEDSDWIAFFTNAANNTPDAIPSFASNDIDSKLICSTCGNDMNCMFDGVCINGTCHCAIGALGAICQIPPVGNGHCDQFYNRLQFEYDGGDCCDFTCVSTPEFTCGMDNSSFVNVGYPFCRQSGEGWNLNGGSIQGVRASGSGLAVALSDNGAILALTEPLVNRVKLFDKVGSQWVQRGGAIDSVPIAGEQNLVLGTALAMSSARVTRMPSGGSIQMVSNPFTMTPVSLAVGTTYSKGYVFVYDCTNNGCVQFGKPIAPFEETRVPLNSVVDIAGRGGSIVAVGAVVAPIPDFFAPLDVFPLAIFDRDLSGGWTPRKFDLYFGTSEGIYSVSLSRDGNILAVASYTSGFSPESGIYIRDDIRRTYTWNGIAFKKRGNDIIDRDPHPALLFSLQGQSMALSDDGNLLALGLWGTPDGQRGTRIVAWDESVSDWIQRGSIITCDGAFELQGYSIAFSSDGGIVSIGAADYNNADSWGTTVGVNGTVCGFGWTGMEWEQLGRCVQGGHLSSVALSGDGSAMAVGLPFADVKNSGMSSVYEFPKESCPNGTSHFRISFMTDDRPAFTSWEVVSNHTGEVLLFGGPYSPQWFFTSSVGETCVNTADDCLVFTVYDNLDLNVPRTVDGLRPPAGHALFLDGKEFARGTLAGAVERVFFGNCLECPEGTRRFQMLIQTCAPVAWDLVDSSGETLFSNNNFDEYSGRWENDCSFANQTTYWEEQCLSVDQCSIFSVSSPHALKSSQGDMYDMIITSSPNLQYRLFFDNDEIAEDMIPIFNVGNQQESVGSCGR